MRAAVAALRLYLLSADVTVIRRLYIAARHWSKARARARACVRATLGTY